MDQRSIVGESRAGSISRLQARQAAKAVKMAKPRGRATTSSSKTIRERYLGHFGVTRSTTGPRNSAGVSKSAAGKKAGSK